METYFKNISLLIILVISSLLMSLSVKAAEAPEMKQVSSKKIEIVSINTASAKELSKGLKGIGKAKADAIVAYRESNGAFAKIEDLLKVDGIGKKILENNKGRINL